MTNYKSLTLYPSGLIGYREERPEIKTNDMFLEYGNVKKLEAWTKSGEPVEFFPGEHEKLLSYVTKDWPEPLRLLSALGKGIEVKDFVEIREQYYEAVYGIRYGTFAFFKSPAVTTALCPTCNHEREVQGNETKSFVPTVEKVTKEEMFRFTEWTWSNEVAISEGLKGKDSTAAELYEQFLTTRKEREE